MWKLTFLEAAQTTEMSKPEYKNFFDNAEAYGIGLAKSNLGVAIKKGFTEGTLWSRPRSSTAQKACVWVIPVHVFEETVRAMNYGISNCLAFYSRSLTASA